MTPVKAQDKEHLKLLIQEHMDVSNVEQISHIFQDSGFEGFLREWNLYPQVEVVRPFSKFHDSMLGLLECLMGNMRFQKTILNITD